MICGEEEGSGPVVGNSFHRHGEGISNEFCGARCWVGDRHVVEGLLPWLDGVVVGLGFGQGDFYKTSAKMGAGVSGGAAFSVATGEFIGVPTGASSSEDPTDSGDILGLIRPSSYAVPLLERAEELSND